MRNYLTKYDLYVLTLLCDKWWCRVYIEYDLFDFQPHKKVYNCFPTPGDKAASKSIAQYAVSSGVSYLAALGTNGEDKFNKAYPQEKSSMHQ